MIVTTDIRRIFTGFFRQRWKFFFTFVPVFLGGFFYAVTATPEFDSTAKLLVKFGQDARPSVTSQSNGSEGSSVDEHRELVQSNVNIMTSRDLAEALFRDIPIARVYPKLAAKPPVRGTLMDAAVRKFADDLVIKTEADSDIITVHLYNPAPHVARLLLGRLVDLFIARQSEIYANPQTTILKDQARAAHERLNEAQKKLSAYKKETGIVSIEEEMTLLLKQRNDLAEEMLGKERAYAHYKAGPSNAMNNDPEVQAIQKQMHALDRQISGTAQRKARYDDLAREIDIDADNYQAAETRAQEAEANQSLNQEKITRISVIEQPTLPYKPSRPWKAMIVAFSFLAGLMLALAACVIAEMLDPTFSFPEQASAALGLPVFASFACQRNSRTLAGSAS